MGQSASAAHHFFKDLVVTTVAGHKLLLVNKATAGAAEAGVTQKCVSLQARELTLYPCPSESEAFLLLRKRRQAPAIQGRSTPGATGQQVETSLKLTHLFLWILRHHIPLEFTHVGLRTSSSFTRVAENFAIRAIDVDQ